MVNDHRVAGEGKVPGQHHHAVGRGAAGLAGDGVELGGIGAAALLAVCHLYLSVVHQCHGVFRRVHETAGPQLFPRGGLVQAPDRIAELGIGGIGGCRFRVHLHGAKVLGQHDEGVGERFAVHGNVHRMPAGGRIVGRRDVGAPAVGGAHALHIAKVGLHGRGGVAGHAGDAHAHDAALLHPLGGERDVRAGLQGEPEGIPVPPRGLCGALQPQIFAQGTGAAALELGGHAALGHAPEGHFGLVFAVGREEEALVFAHAAGKYHTADRGLDGQSGVAGPVRQSNVRVRRVQGAQLLHREGGRAGKHLVQLAAQQRHLPAEAVGLQLLAAELRGSIRAAALRGKGIAHPHHSRQQQGHAQCNADDPQQKTLHVLLLLCSKKAHPRSLWSDCRCASFVSGVWFILQHPRQVPLRQLPARPFLHRPRQRADARTRPVPFRGGAGKQPQQPVLRQQRPGQ